MKTLLLLRHAKSSWDSGVLNDFHRPLNKRGKKAAPLMGRYLKEQQIVPEVVLCSPARRTRDTLGLFLEKAMISPELRFVDGIYEADIADLLAVVGGLDTAVRTALVVGHNPGMSDLLEYLTGRFDPFPTAALAQIGLDAPSWAELKKGSGQLAWIVRPRELAADLDD